MERHGLYKTRLYNIWHGMKKRCNTVTDKAYKNYGGRGIKICKEWNDNFVSFYNWAMSNGYDDRLTIERIDVNKGYNPQNCCWIPLSEQAKNERRTVRMYNGIGMECCAFEVAKKHGIPVATMHKRIREGWEVDRACTIPVEHGRNKKEVEQCDSITKQVICTYESLKEAERKTGFISTTIRAKCNNGGGIYKGYFWRYKKKMEIQVKYLADIEPIKRMDIGNMIDLRCSEDIVMKKGEFKLIPLGVAMKLPTGYYAQVYPRSSTFLKYKILMANSVGIIDNSYSGNNDMWYFPALAVEDTEIKKNTRICQFNIYKEHDYAEIHEVIELTSVDRGGIGSTGEK